MLSAAAISERGRGDTAVLLLHGIGGGRSIWSDAASGTSTAIADAGFRAVALDLPGYGDAATTCAPDLQTFVAAVRDVIARLGAARNVLVGHSMGGMIAQELVHREPGSVQGLVLACTSSAFGAADGRWQARFVTERLAPLDAGLGMMGLAERLVDGLVSPAAGPAARQVAVDIMGRVPEPTYRAALRAIAGFDRRAELAAIAVPTLMLAAEHDATAPPALMQRMAARVAGAEFACLAGAGHIANVEAPAAFNAAVVSFLRRHFMNPAGRTASTGAARATK